MKKTNNNNMSYNEAAKSGRTRLLSAVLLIIILTFIVVAFAAAMSKESKHVVSGDTTAYAAADTTTTTTTASSTEKTEDQDGFVCTCRKDAAGCLDNIINKDGCKIYVCCSAECENYKKLLRENPDALIINTTICGNEFNGDISIGDIGEGAVVNFNVQSIVDSLKNINFSSYSSAVVVGDYATVKNAVLGTDNDGNQMNSVDNNKDSNVVQDDENSPVQESPNSNGGNANANVNRSPSGNATNGNTQQQLSPEKKPTVTTNTKPSTTTKPNETKPSATKPSATRPSETKPSATKPSETKPSETKPSETKPSETKPARVSPVVTFASNNTTQGCYFTVTGLEKGDVVKCNYSYELIDSDASSMYARVQLTLNGGDTVLVTVVDANGNIVAESYVTMYATNQ